MALINGSNYAKEFINVPSEAANIGEYNGKQRVSIDSFAGAVGSDDVNFAKLPIGAFILAFGNVGAGTAPVFSKSIGDKIDSADVLAGSDTLVCTLDGDAAASGKIWVEYSLD